MTDDPATRTEGEGETLDMPEGLGAFSKGQVLGERYQILEMLGRGGMGEVWQAFDLKLRVEVALKALRSDLFKSDRRLELLRQEVRAAREVMSPNVCRIFDLIEIEGRELVSMEYVDGATLLGVLQERGPLELKEAQDIASQFLAGLDAIHRVGLIHRDIKPENIMLTRAGRVVVMDFGLARQDTEGGGSVSGTPAYMAPEQAAGRTLDARADVYSAGVVLAEMVSPEGIKSFESRQSLWEGVRSEPAKLPDSPWAPVLKKAVAKDRENRYHTAHTLTRALEDVTLRVEGAEDLHPYPGLASFTEDDAEYFFGREAEVEQMWRKLEGPARMLALVGPSGAGKTSFLQAGLFPTATAQWATAICKPGNNPQLALGRALAPEMAGDADVMDLLLRFDDPDVAVEVLSRWRDRNDCALLVIDQFEELFTQNSADEQRRFAELLNRLVLDADVCVLLSMRDDFLMRCRDFEALQPTFADMTALPTLAGQALRRALVRPATKCGYRFEDDELVDEMLAEVEGERGALPLLAFAAAQLWEKRDRETGLLTREAYHDIGGVGGALARHAEATIDRIGSNRITIVRELFRNLVTAEGTRAVREWNDLLSIFSDSRSESPAAVLRALIDARLLTSYEVREEDREPTRRVEIIHESLLANWPRLVRWQTQDADAAQRRDQLRQAARTWDEQGRTDDTLWTGSAYREFAVWRERYPGGLTEIEEMFSAAMTTLAGRRRRRRRMAVAAVLVIATAVTAVTTSLWRRSVVQERRAEAQKLIAIGQLRLEDYPTATLAYATQGLELADSEEGRFLALEALWEGPPAFVVNEVATVGASFSPGGSWLVQSHDFMSSLAVISRDGSQRVMDHPSESGKTRSHAFFLTQEDLFLSFGMGTDYGQIALWSAAEGRLLASAKPVEDLERLRGAALSADGEKPRALFMLGTGNLVTIEALNADGSHERLGEYRMTVPVGQGGGCMPDATGEWFGVLDSNEVYVVEIGAGGLSELRLLGRHEGDLIPRCVADPLGRFLLTMTRSGEIRIWDVSGQKPPINLVGPPDGYPLFSNDGSYFYVGHQPSGETTWDVWIWFIRGFELTFQRRLEGVTATGFSIGSAFDPQGPRLAIRGTGNTNLLWPLAAPDGAEPLALRPGTTGYVSAPAFSPGGRWLATCDSGGLTLWPLGRPYPAVIRFDIQYWLGALDFGPDGRFLATAGDGAVSLFPLEGPVPAPSRTVFEVNDILSGVAVSPNGEMFAAGRVGGRGNGIWIGRDGGDEPLQLPIDVGRGSFNTSFSPDGRLVASMTGVYDRKNAVFRVWDVQSSNEIAALSLTDDEFRWASSFTRDGHLLAATSKGVISWDAENSDHEILVEADVRSFIASDDGQRLLVTEGNDYRLDPTGPPVFFDLATGTSTTLSAHGLRVKSMALDRDGTVAVTGDFDGIIRVGPVTGDEPHLLLGHDGAVTHLEIDPRGRWIASGGEDKTVRLWPMPDLSKPPLHTLPREELIAKLKTLTNLRVVRDAESSTGWTLTHDPFPGWETVPTW